MDKQALVHSSNGILLLCNNKEWTTDISANMDESQDITFSGQMHTEKNILYDFT